MKRVFALIIAVIVIFSVSNLALAQGQGKGKGKGLIENRGIQNGNGFTTGQGHLNGNSAVDVTDCVDEAIASLTLSLASDGWIVLGAERTDYTWYGDPIFVMNVKSSANYCFYIQYYATKDESGVCQFEYLYYTYEYCPE